MKHVKIVLFIHEIYIYYVRPPPVAVEHGKNMLSPCFTLMNNNLKERVKI